MRVLRKGGWGGPVGSRTRNQKKCRFCACLIAESIPTWEAKNSENDAQTERCATTTAQDKCDESAKKQTAQKNTFFALKETLG